MIYDWSKAPADAMACATDDGGIAYWFNKNPERKDILGFWGSLDDLVGIAYGVGKSPFVGDWRESLEQRPQHPCAGKCPRFDKEQCKSCLVGDE